MRPAFKKAHSFYVLLCIGAGIWVQHGTAHPDVFLGLLYGAAGSWIGPGMVAAGIAQMLGWGKLGVPVMLFISVFFWAMWFSLAKSAPRLRKAAPMPPAPQPVFTLRRIIRTYTERN